MNHLHVLVDFENVQPTFDEVARLAPGLSEVWLFHGPHQINLAQQFKAAHTGVISVPISKSGKNALDFHLSFYLGYVAAKNPHSRLLVIANDKGYDPMIVHAKTLGFTTQRVGFKAKKTVPMNKGAAAKAAKKAAPAKKVIAKKATPVKKAPAAKTLLPKKSAAAKMSVPAQAQPVVLSPAETLVTRVIKGLAKMGKERPAKIKPFLRHVGSMLGKDVQPDAVQEMVQQLETAGVIQVNGDTVVYTG